MVEVSGLRGLVLELRDPPHGDDGIRSLGGGLVHGQGQVGEGGVIRLHQHQPAVGAGSRGHVQTGRGVHRVAGAGERRRVSAALVDLPEAGEDLVAAGQAVGLPVDRQVLLGRTDVVRHDDGDGLAAAEEVDGQPVGLLQILGGQRSRGDLRGLGGGAGCGRCCRWPPAAGRPPFRRPQGRSPGWTAVARQRRPGQPARVW